MFLLILSLFNKREQKFGKNYFVFDVFFEIFNTFVYVYSVCFFQIKNIAEDPRSPADLTISNTTCNSDVTILLKIQLPYHISFSLRPHSRFNDCYFH